MVSLVCVCIYQVLKVGRFEVVIGGVVFYGIVQFGGYCDLVVDGDEGFFFWWVFCLVCFYVV